MTDKICSLILLTPIGRIKLVHSFRGVQEIKLNPDHNLHSQITGMKYDEDQEVSVLSHEGPWFDAIDNTMDWLKNFFSQKNLNYEGSNLPEIDNEIFEKENFTGKVLRTLASEVPSGSTVSYAELASKCGNPKACRAVGQAMRMNPVPLIVPCHRVVSSDGKPGHYMRGQGDNIKKWLIGFEKNI